MMRRSLPQFLPLAFAVLALLLAACERERRELRPPAAAANRPVLVRQTSLQPGRVVPAPPATGPYDENAFGISEGQRLFNWYNCSGCHSHGGGGMGPPLMDGKWIYGSEPQNIYGTIVEGRPNGMPSWGGRIPSYQVWEIVAYVRSLSGLTPKNAVPARADEMQAKEKPSEKDQHPIGVPAEHPG
jgi:cytochrome c oxidase cbb3-type subunit III